MAFSWDTQDKPELQSIMSHVCGQRCELLALMRVQTFTNLCKDDQTLQTQH